MKWKSTPDEAEARLEELIAAGRKKEDEGEESVADCISGLERIYARGTARDAAVANIV